MAIVVSRYDSTMVDPRSNHFNISERTIHRRIKREKTPVPRPRDYGLIYNWDGQPYAYSEVPQSMEQFLNKVYAPLEDTQVEALFWCMGGYTATWKSEAMEIVAM